MRIDGIFSNTVDLLGKSIDLRAKNQNLIAANIANAETPNYIPKTLQFESELQGAMKNDRAGDYPSSAVNMDLATAQVEGGRSSVHKVTGKVVDTPSKQVGRDGNAVEVETEMGKMAENQIMFNASVQMLSKKFEGLRTAIKGAL